MFADSRSRDAFLWIGFLFYTLLFSARAGSFTVNDDGGGDFLLQAWQSEDGLPHQVVNGVL